MRYNREYLESNKLIAMFMGAKPTKNHPDKSCWLRIKSNKTLTHQYWHLLNYDKSWDWLKPVIKKIGSLPYDENPGVREYLNNKNGSWYLLNIYSSISLTYDAVVKFIKWYNEEGNKKKCKA